MQVYMDYLLEEAGLKIMANSQDLVSRIERVEEDNEAEAVVKPFDPNKISLQIKQPTIDNIMKRLMADPSEIDLQTIFQRKGYLWDAKQKSRLIESLLLRIPLPAFYFDGTDDDKWLVVDGLQRLTTFYSYMGVKNFKLQGLEYLTDFEDHGFDDLPRSMQRRIEETQVTAYIIQPGTPEEVKFNIFKRINTGGLPLSPQEIRHALNQGVAADFLEELAAKPAFAKIFKNISKERMEDREFVLRFLSFYLLGYQNYEPDMDGFLNQGMKYLAQISEDEREKCKKKFIRSMKRAYQIFEKYVFRKVWDDGEHRKRGPLNKSLFDVWSVCLAQLDADEYVLLLQSKNKLLDAFVQLLSTDKKFERSITSGTGGKAEVNIRFTKIQEIVRGVLGYAEENSVG